MSPTRRKIIGDSTAAAVALSTAGPWHSQTLTARQYHSPSEDGCLQLYLPKIWEAVRQETVRRLSSTVYARNKGATAGGPKIFRQRQAGALNFFTLTRNILNLVAPAPAADIQGKPFAFSLSQQVAALNGGEFGSNKTGSKQITCTDRPIQKADNLLGFKMREPHGTAPKIVDFTRLYQALAAHEICDQDNLLFETEETSSASIMESTHDHL